MIKTLSAITSLPIAFLVLVVVLPKVTAEEVDYLCFMRDGAGRAVNLSESVCGFKPDAISVNPDLDSAFIAGYRNLTTNKPAKIRNLLLELSAGSPELLINEAKGVCEGIKAGLSLDTIRRLQTRAVSRSSIYTDANMVSTELINALGPQYYCPSSAAK
ncbi:MAG: hypothetical protein KME12_03385 [Trichocoleus desertorum ATA4-8-CV12]|jgi:hypothetical protein|nr:hypothetical protein [Trichocoleus desertorum ATA4-8-CV12]